MAKKDVSVKLANLNFSWYDETLPELVIKNDDSAKNNSTKNSEEKNGNAIDLRNPVSPSSATEQPGGVSLPRAEQPAPVGVVTESIGNDGTIGSLPVDSAGNRPDDLSRGSDEAVDATLAVRVESVGDSVGSSGLGRGLSDDVGGGGNLAGGSGEQDAANQSGDDLLGDDAREVSAFRVAKVKKTGINFTVPDDEKTPLNRTLKDRFEANISAINTLRNITSEGRLATAEEQLTLARFSGFGGMANFFSSGNFYLPYTSYKEIGELALSVIDGEVDAFQQLEVENKTFQAAYQTTFQRSPESLQLALAMQKLSFAIFIKKIQQGRASEKVAQHLVEYREAIAAQSASNEHPYTSERDIDSAHYSIGDEIKREFSEMYGAARASILNAFYTPPSVSEAMWAGLRTMGFTQEATQHGVNVIDPSLGAGSFLSSAPDFVKENASFCGIELDTLTALISKQLYQREDIRESGFETARLVDNFFDLAISNIPFGDYKVYDQKFNRHKLSIHNYFFAKALTKVKEGGIVAFVTSSYTMDAQGKSHRELINKSAELVAAFRLPADVFKGAGVSVTTDIIFLRKRELAQKLSSEAAWIESNAAEFPNKEGVQEKILLNEYFIDHPENILGDVVVANNQFGVDVMTVKNENWLPLLNDKMAALPSNVYQLTGKNKVAEVALIEAPEGTHNGNMIVVEGLVYQNIANVLARREDLDKKLLFVSAMVNLRSATREHLKIQSIWAEESERFVSSKENLNATYDAFVKDFGYLNDKKNRKTIIEEIDSPLLFSLEKWNEITQKAEKSDIFLKHTAKINQDMEIKSISDGVIYSLNERGFIDVNLIAEKLTLPEKHVKDELIDAGIAFINPVTQELEESGKYLSGNVREKLVIARVAAETDVTYIAHVTALEAIQPKYIPAGDIAMKLGAPWLPIPVLEKFIKDISGFARNIQVIYEPSIPEWKVQFDDGRGKHPGIVKNTSNFGSKDFPASMLAEMAMNQKQPKVTYMKGDKVFIDVAKTAQIRETQSRLKAYFTEFVLANEDLAKQVEENYNQQVNNIHLREYSGKHLVIPGMNSAFNLRDSQKDGIWRIMSGDNNTLLDHCVGAGKTATIIGAAMECRRIKKASKPMIVVPNNILEQMAGNFADLYPSAKILVAHDYFTGKAQRRLFQSQIATGDWDSIIISYSAFEKISVTPATRARHIREQIENLEDVSTSTQEVKLIKRLEKRIKNLEAKLEKLLETKDKDETVYFEDLGVDMLLVDEADNFKNLGFETKMQRIPGLSDVRSARAEDMFMKTGLVKKVVFATGTPISNTIGEMYTMMRYLYRDKLHEHGIRCFDDFATTFTDTVTAIEMTPDGGGYRMATRFARFNNVPELMAIYKSFADIKTKEMLNLPVPKTQANVVSAKPSQALLDYIQTLVVRSEKIASGRIDPTVDNKLKITSDGRKAALDLRLVDEGQADDPNSKVNLMVEAIFKQYQSGKEVDLLQLVFCDLGINSVGGDGLRRFSVYNDIRAKLIAKGMKPHEVRFAQDAKDSNELEQIFSQARAGQVRVLLGSTIKMGAGTNVQKYLSDIHHLDCPWRPRDIEQRNGRGERQGNLNEHIRLHCYITEKTFDAYQWQGLETKLGFVNQIRNGKSDCRSIEDISSRALSFSEIKALATGNPLVIKKFGLEQDISRLSTLESGFRDMMDERRRRLYFMNSAVESFKLKLAGVQKDMDLAALTANEKFAIKFTDIDTLYFKFEGGDFTDDEVASEKLNKFVSAVALSDAPSGDIKFGEFRGFELRVSYGKFGNEIIIKGACEHEIRHRSNFSVKALSRFLDGLEVKTLQAKLKTEEFELAAMTLSCQEKSPYAEKSHDARATLDAINKELGLLDNDTGEDDADGASDGVVSDNNEPDFSPKA